MRGNNGQPTINRRILFALFLLLAAAVEAVLEIFRGCLERFGLAWLKGKTSLDDALKLASDISPGNEFLAAKLNAVGAAASQIKKVADKKKDELEKLKQSLIQATNQSAIDSVTAGMNEVASSVKGALDADERRRIFVLKILSAGIGILFAWTTDFQIFRILASNPEAPELSQQLAGLQNCWLNYIAGGIAAAAGINYWHDQLDRVRAVKSSLAQARQLAS